MSVHIQTGDAAALASLTMSGNITFSPTTKGTRGTVAVDNAEAGNVGELISASVVRSSGLSLVTGTAKTITSISLTAGDWDVYGACGFEGAASTSFTSTIAGISTATDTNPGADTIAVADSTGQIRMDYAEAANVHVSPFSRETPPVRVSISVTTIYYLIATATFSVSTAIGYGSIAARRVR